MRKLNSQINSELSEAVWYSPVPNYKGKRFDKVESDLSTIPVLRRPFCFRFEVRKGICSVLVGLQPFIAENLERIRSPLTRPLHWNGLWWVYLEVSKKLFWKKNLVRCYGFLKRLDSGQITLFFVVVFFFYCWESSLLWIAQSWQCFRKIRGGGGCFLDNSNPCILTTVGHIKTNLEVLGRLQPHFFLLHRFTRGRFT